MDLRRLALRVQFMSERRLRFINEAQENDPVEDGFRLPNTKLGQETLEEKPYVTAEKMNTISTVKMDALTLRLHVSKDEEHISLDIVYGDEVVELRESALFGPLYLLAQRRWKDKAAGELPEKEHGWMHTVELADELDLNRTVCRLRKLLHRVGVHGAWNVVERRRKKIRIGTGRLLGLESPAA